MDSGDEAGCSDLKCSAMPDPRRDSVHAQADANPDLRFCLFVPVKQLVGNVTV